MRCSHSPQEAVEERERRRQSCLDSLIQCSSRAPQHNANRGVIMRTSFLSVVLALGMAGLVSAHSPHPNSATLKKQFVTWLKSNNAFGADHPLVKDLSGGVEKLLKDHKDFVVILGPKLTRSGKAVALASHGEVVAALELTEEQFKKTKVKASGASISEGTTYDDIVDSDTPFPIEIEKPKFKDGLTIDGNKEIKGELPIFQKDPPFGKFSVRLTLVGENLNTTLFSTFEEKRFNSKTVIPFTFGKLNMNGKKFQGPAIAFVDLCVVKSNRPEATVISNAKPLLLNFK
jgi:hypothetical protein